MTTNQNTPILSLTDGRIKAAIWKNQSEKGAFYSVTFTRSYRDDTGDWHDTESFSGTELLILGRLSVRAYDAIAKLRSEDRSADADAA
ncbi:MAG: hypothetical protein KDA31_14615 [Phycisphaerales bacterium]|nr:hypothetical protein [Phycisphaerales bacterium]MCB9836047.1 hypothetical protein [Phycisphaera sp.]